MLISSLYAVPGSGNLVVEILAWTALLLVVAMLILSVWRQFNLLGRHGQIADSLGIMPQWKFFALSSIETREDHFDDYHLLVRAADAKDELGSWQAIFWNEERKWFHILWNPHLRAQAGIQIPMMNLVSSGDDATTETYQSSLAYLTLLLYCLDDTTLRDGEAIQFAIVTSRGCNARRVAVRYLSAWHTV